MTANKIRAITFVLIPWVLIPAVTVATNYFPLATVPEWHESMKTLDSWGEEYVYHSRNLISVGGTGPVIPIIPPIQFGNILIETEYDWSNPILEGGSTVSVTSSEVSESALKRMQQASSGTCDAGLSCRIENYWETNPDWTNPRRGVPRRSSITGRNRDSTPQRCENGLAVLDRDGPRVVYQRYRAILPGRKRSYVR